VKETKPDKRKVKSGLSFSKRFERFIEDESLFEPQSRILLAVSSGVDSMVMFDLFSKAGFEIAVAHCNFGLRGNESDEDAIFVEKEVRARGVDFFSKNFHTASYSTSSKQSIQEAARELRYEWFEQLAKEHRFDYVATGHNLNDSVETLLINLIRGTGLRGLAGIPLKNGNIIRPLLFAARSEIEEYAQEKSIKFRTDSSNLQFCYLRNKIRHKIMPILQEANPSLYSNMKGFFDDIKEAMSIVGNEVLTQKNACVEKTISGFSINIQSLTSCQSPRLVLYEILKDFGFSSSVCHDLYNSLGGQSGKVFFSKTHRAIKDREKVFVEAFIPTPLADKRVIVDEETKQLEVFGQVFVFSIKPYEKGLQIPADPNIAWLDRERLKFPLEIRKILPGDAMLPLGMKGKKKISDILIDKKTPLQQKEATVVIISENQIAWLAGLKISQNFKISSRTKEILEIARTCDKYHI